MDRAPLAIRHLLLRLRPINRALRAAVEARSEATARLARPDLSELCITPDHAGALLEDVDLALQGPRGEPVPLQLTADEAEAEARLRAEAQASGSRLPLDELEAEVPLAQAELEALLLCAAPEVDIAYERLYAYILDDLQRRASCVELIASLAAGSTEERLRRRGALGRLGRLRRCGLLRTLGEAPSEWRQELRLAPGVLELLLGQEGWVRAFRDPAEVALPEPPWLPAGVEVGLVRRLGEALADGRLGTVGVWGRRADGQPEVVQALARAARRPLRRLLAPVGEGDPEPAVREAVEAAAVTGSLLWVALDELGAPSQERLRGALASVLSRARVATCLSGALPWRPAELLEARPYAEVRLAAADFAARRAMWLSLVPELTEAEAADRAARLHVGPSDVRAIAEVARAGVRVAPVNGKPVTVQSQLEEATAIVIRKRTEHVARIVLPRRQPQDLVLPAELHRQVLEVAQFFRDWPRVSEEWGLGRVVSASRGVKALFTGDPGTGKTLAAEVIAASVGLSLFKVDLAQVVSKWVGETEKNLEAVFREAEESHAVLFFDEAEALFGKRGEVQHGTDRYANLEVSYLLQRLEDYEGLAVLASNLKDQIDPAFTRRFSVVLHFPRPGEAERLRIWKLALAEAQLAGVGVDLPVLARLDLTGAGIVQAVRTAALLAAQAGGEGISMGQLVEGVARQYRREARVLSGADLGVHRGLLGGVA